MMTRRHSLFALAALAACFLALSTSARAEDVTLYKIGSGETLGYGIKNVSGTTRYVVSVEVTRIDPKTGSVILKHTDELTLSPRADIFLGQARQQGIEVQYRILNVRVAAGSSVSGGRPGSNLPAPYPVLFGK